MKKNSLVLTFILASQLIFAQIIHIPNDYPSIQEGIDAASAGETVLVNPGTYVENINFNGKNITVGSLYLNTLDTSYISSTIINGNAAGSVVTISSGEGQGALLTGFTLTNGLADAGGGIYIFESSPHIEYLKIKNNTADYGGGIYMDTSASVLQHILLTDNVAEGGGISCNNSTASFNNITFLNNSAPHYGGGMYCDESPITMTDVVFKNNTANNFGGAIFCWGESNFVLENASIRNNSAENGGGMSIWDSSPELKSVSITYNTAAKTGGGLDCNNSIPTFDDTQLCNVYLNEAAEGSDFFSDKFLEVSLDTFTVLSPTDYYASQLGNYSFSIVTAVREQTAANLYVSPLGDDANSGISPTNPLKTIRHATSKILADSTQQRNIYLMEGIYSPPGTGESFPINLTDYINLIGESATKVILDADSSSGVIDLLFNKSSKISGLTIQGGNASKGGGVYAELSNLRLENIKIKNNNANYGAAAFLDESIANLTDVLVSGNEASVNGGGLYFANARADIINSTIADNTAGNMAGGLHNYRSLIYLINTIMWNDTPQEMAFISSGGTGNYGLIALNSNVMGGEENIENPDSNYVSWAESNIDEDPIFLGRWDDPYQLDNGSTCIDAGTTDTTLLFLPEFDLGGDARFNGDFIDIGAYEWNLFVGSEDLLENDKFDCLIYPNPVADLLTIEFESPIKYVCAIELFNSFGTHLKTVYLTKQKSLIDMNTFPSGIYFLLILDDGKIITKKLVKL